jgi:aryl-alcohol dehydrogenase-like predicted oxidoreductase
MPVVPQRRLGSSDLEVSLFSLGSWRTFERIPREQGLAVMRAARDAGITFLDDARYNDETGTAPIPTGYSEVVFGELFRAAGWVRDEVVVCNKLWWEFWPEQDAAAELDASLARMGLDHIDLIYTMQPPDGLTIAELVEQVAGLVSSGRARAWGIGNWPAVELTEAVRAARLLGAPLPAAAQLPYSLVRADWVQDPVMEAVLADADIGLVASYVLAGGTLTGKYLDPGTGRGESGRATADTTPAVVAGKERAAVVVELAREWNVTPASLAFSFALSHPRLASVLFGATSPEQLRENVASLDVFNSLDDDQRRRLNDLALS